MPLQKLTKTERADLRHLVHGVTGYTDITIGDNGDGTWFADVYGLIMEADSAPALLRELADALGES